MNIFNRERALTPAWDLLPTSLDLLRQYLLPVLYLSVLPQLLVTLATIMSPHHTITTSLRSGNSVTATILLSVGSLWGLLAYPGLTLFLAMTAQGKEISTREAFTRGLKRFFPFIGASILAGLIVCLGIIAFVIPGIILLRRYYLTAYYVVERGLGPLQAMKQSSADSKPVSAWIWGTIGVTMVFGIAASFVGIIPIIGPVASVIVSYLYVYGPALRYCEVVGLKTVPIKK